MNRKRFGLVAVAFAVTLGALGLPALAGKPGGKPGGGDPSYTLVDLLGLPGWALQSDGQFLTNRDATGILIAGNSHLYSEPGSPARRLPALWSVDAQGNLGPDDPLNLGLPSSAAEIEVVGINRSGVIVSTTRIANEKDDDDNWVFPSFVDIPGQPYQELPIPDGASRYTGLEGINDNGQIIGSYGLPDPDTPGSYVGYSAVWQVETDGTISGPVDLGFYAKHINNFGVMAGHLDGYPAIAWFEGETLVIDQLDTSLRFWGADTHALNDYPIGDDRLTVVGRSFRNEEGDYQAYDYMRGFAWRPFNADDPSTVLGTLGGRSSGARDVNNSGQIVGWADVREGWTARFHLQRWRNERPEFDGRCG